MAKNIYELFNERKNGMDCLVEGYDVEFEDAEGFENLDVAAESLSEITESFNNEMMEFQAACYLEELIIESMIYDDFDEERIGTVIEGTLKEKASGLVAKLKEYWEKLKNWVKNAYQTVANLFKSGEALVKQHGPANVASAIKKCEKKVKLPEYNAGPAALDQARELMGKTYDIAGMTKNEVLAKFEVKKAKDIDEKVHKMFVKGDKREVTINQLPAAEVVEVVERKKALLDSLGFYSKRLDIEFKEAISVAERAKKGGPDGAESDQINNAIEAFKFGQALKNRIVGRAMSEYKSMFHNYCSVIKAAVNPMRAAKAAKKGEDEKKAEEVKESLKFDEIEFL